MSKKTKVIFRKFNGGYIVALFPDSVDQDWKYAWPAIKAYDIEDGYTWVTTSLMRRTKAATREDYLSLYNELRRQGLKLEVCKRTYRKPKNRKPRKIYVCKVCKQRRR